ncbi:hypothetical protein PMI01_02014 [Caulobacter sp. AP07]|nr:hypothetical protein PMI01_02014 [Caulobacter sp. AP07]
MKIPHGVLLVACLCLASCASKAENCRFGERRVITGTWHETSAEGVDALMESSGCRPVGAGRKKDADPQRSTAASPG